VSRAPVVVVGANGLVGSRIAARLCSRERVIAIGRGPARDEMQGLLASSRDSQALIEYEEIDLALEGPLQDLIETRRPSAVIFAAGMTDVDACERDVPMAWQLNVRSVEEAALGCRSTSARFVSLSTDYVFNGASGPYHEESETSPRGVYARTKRAGEEAALLLAPNCVVARVAAIFSGRKGAKKTFAVGVAQALRAGKEVRAFRDQIVSPTLADNAAELCIAALDSNMQGILHCAGAEAVTRVDFCQRLARKLGADGRLVIPTALADLKLLAPRPLSAGLVVERIRTVGGHPLALDVALDRFLQEEAEASR